MHQVVIHPVGDRRWVVECPRLPVGMSPRKTREEAIGIVEAYPPLRADDIKAELDCEARVYE